MKPHRDHVELPDALPLNGTDNFLLALDTLMRRRGQPGNICRVALSVQGLLDRERLCEALRNHPLSIWMIRARLRRGGVFTPARWIQSDSDSLPVHMHPPSNAFPPAPDILRSDLRPEAAPPVRFDLIPAQDGSLTLLVFHWHHCLMDSRGAESYLNSLGGQTPPSRPVIILAQPAGKSAGWRKSMEAIRSCKQRIYASCEPGFFHPISSGVSQDLHHILTLSEEETQKSDEAVAAAGAGLQHSAFYIQATASALSEVLSPGRDSPDFLTSLPQDARRRGVEGPILSNQLSFMFFRLPGKVLHKPTEAVREVSQQMKEMIREDFTTAHAVMLDKARFLPGPIFRHLLQSPTRGNIGSCSFSDTGASLGKLESFLGKNVEHAVHFPPNMTPPGITVVANRFASRLTLTVVAKESALPPDRAAMFVDALKKRVLS